MNGASILVTGASGKLGRRVLELLLEGGTMERLVATTRTPASLADLAARGVEVRKADFDDAEGLERALDGVERALLVSTDSLERPGHRRAQQARAVGALVGAGVQHIVYTSITNPVGSQILISKDHADTEATLASSGVTFTILRNNMYAELALDSIARAAATGQLVNARGAGKIGFVTRDDCAAAAAAALREPAQNSRTLDITGPEALSSSDVATLISELSGRAVTHVSVPVAALVDGMVQHGLPRALAEIYASFDVGIAAGELDLASDHVERLTGQKPRHLRDVLLAQRSAWLG